jgi:hypothetical protein
VEKVTFAIPGNPQSKPVERFFRTMDLDFVKQLPGYCGGSPADKPETLEADRKAKNLLTWRQVEELLGKWVADVYEDTPHTGNGMDDRSPNQVWAGLSPTYQKRTVAPSALALLFMPHRPVKVGRQGVRLRGNLYWSQEVYRHFGETVMLKYDPADLDKSCEAFDAKGHYLGSLQKRNLGGFHDEESYKETQRMKRAVKAITREHMAQVQEAQKRHSLEDRVLMRDIEKVVPPEPGVSVLTRTIFDDEAMKRKRAAGAGMAAATSGVAAATPDVAGAVEMLPAPEDEKRQAAQERLVRLYGPGGAFESKPKVPAERAAANLRRLEERSAGL